MAWYGCILPTTPKWGGRPKQLISCVVVVWRVGYLGSTRNGVIDLGRDLELVYNVMRRYYLPV